MGVLKIRINQRLLHCRHCHRHRHPPLPPADTPLPPANTHCFLLDRIIHQMRFKCNFCDSGYIPYSKFLVHLRDTTPAHLKSVFARGECILTTSALVCSECGLPLWPPIFWVSSALPCPIEWIWMQFGLVLFDFGFMLSCCFCSVSLRELLFVLPAAIMVMSPATVTTVSSNTSSKASWWNARLANNTFHSPPLLRTSWSTCVVIHACLPPLFPYFLHPHGGLNNADARTVDLTFSINLFFK